MSTPSNSPEITNGVVVAKVDLATPTDAPVIVDASSIQVPDIQQDTKTNAEVKVVLPPFNLSNRQVFYTDHSYKVIERLGSGGNSDVYLCQATSGDHKGLLFAVKFMVNVARRDRVARFNSELNFLKSIDHPGILKVYDSGSFSFGPAGARAEIPFYISEYLPKTLRDAMRAGMLMVDKVTVAMQLLSSLVFLGEQEMPVIHRDIKPENIFIRGRAAILGDFGLLKALGPEDVVSEFSINDLSKGVRHPRMYPTPELIEYAKSKGGVITSKSDIFQLGLVLAELFCGSHPLKARRGPLDEIELESLDIFSASNAQTIRGLIESMLELDVVRRPSALELFDRWEGPFNEVIADAQRLEGRAFW